MLKLVALLNVRAACAHVINESFSVANVVPLFKFIVSPVGAKSIPVKQLGMLVQNGVVKPVSVNAYDPTVLPEV